MRLYLCQKVLNELEYSTQNSSNYCFVLDPIPPLFSRGVWFKFWFGGTLDFCQLLK